VIRAIGLVSALCLVGTVVPGGALAIAPTIINISPNNGPIAGGTPVTITGAGFTLTGATRVTFGAAAATVVSLGQSELKVKSPAVSASGLVNITVTNSNGTSAAVPRDQFAYDAAPATPWLGLDGNSSGVPAAHLREFVARGIVYDRGGAPGIDMTAGALLKSGASPTTSGVALATSIEAGMIPDVTIEYRGYKGNYTPDPNFPRERTKKEEAEGWETINGYVAGFVSTAKAVHERYPSVVFEPMNEPWGYTTPEYNAGEYASVIAVLLPQAQAAGIPLSSIYVGATGKNCANPAWPTECTSNGWVSAMYAARPKLQTEIQGWYFHPYGPPSGVGEYAGSGIQSLPVVQASMTSGQNNIIVSEVGYCAVAVNGGQGCGGLGEKGNKPAKNLAKMLENALPYREAGWLRALIVYARNGGGWAMQLNGQATLTKSGAALDAFATRVDPASAVQEADTSQETVTPDSLLDVSCASFWHAPSLALLAIVREQMCS
jgi:IPT/TIG domain